MNPVTILIIVIVWLTLLLPVIFILLNLFKSKDNSATQQLLDLKNQLNELKTNQLKSQNEHLIQQQEFFQKGQHSMSEQINDVMKLVNENLTKTQSNINEQLTNTGNVVGDIQKKLGALEESTKNIQEIGKDISSLQDILSVPKLRGNLGEYLLEDLLKQIFPSKNYQMKYSFKDGTQVDAIIRLGDGIVPVDSKFPLESFQRFIEANEDNEKKAHKREFIKSVKTRIDEIALKYINTSENTFDFALMYIPAENVFYEIIITDSISGNNYELFNYAIQKHIIPVSPNSFYAYLMALVFGLKGFKVEQQAKTIINELGLVQKSFSNFYTDFNMIGKHLTYASSKYNEASIKAVKFNEKVSEITNVKMELSTEVEVQVIEMNK